MKKEELIALCKKYNMDWIINNEVEQEKVGLWVESETEIPELDAVLTPTMGPNPAYPVCVFCEKYSDAEVRGATYEYKIYPPLWWLDRWGWK